MLDMATRRAFLKFAAALTGAAGAAELLPASVARAYAIEPEAGSTYLDAEHVVILMQENRSFDHTFGTLRGVRGFNDPRALRLADGKPVFVQTDAAGASYAPWRLDMKDSRVTWMGSLPHSRESQVDAWNEGLHDGWLEAKRPGRKEQAHLPLTMGYYTREDLPFYYALADAFTVCDQHYCSVMTSTSPNRCVFWSGTVRERQEATAPAHMRNQQIDDGGLTWKTFPERLQEAGVSWKCYQNELTRSPLSGEHESWLSNFSDNVLECFDQYEVTAYGGFVEAQRRKLAALEAKLAGLDAKLRGADDAEALRAELAKLHEERAAVERSLSGAGAERYAALSAAQKELHDRAFCTNTADPHCHALEPLAFEAEGAQQSLNVPKGDVLYEFRKDVESKRLPQVSWIVAPERFSDHPSAPWFGAWYISEIMDILTKDPEVWRKTIFVLTYDENDGYFDHAPSYVAADPKRPETGGASEGIDTGLEFVPREQELALGVAEAHARSGPVGMGFRVPMVVASPWTRGGWVNSQLFDHTSTLQFLEGFLERKRAAKVREENISPWRRAVAGDLTSVFRPYEGGSTGLTFVDRDAFVRSIAQAKYKPEPSGFRRVTAGDLAEEKRAAWMPKQEPGTKPSCALPYELYADACRSADGQHVELTLRAGNRVHGARSAGAPFNVYLRGLASGLASSAAMQAATYAVRAGDAVSRTWPMAAFAGEDVELEVHGPNGFYRQWRFAKGAPALAVETMPAMRGGKPTGDVLLRLRNGSVSGLRVEVADKSYGAKPVVRSLKAGAVEAVVVACVASHGWYDVSVSAGPGVAVRCAGRVETGRASVSDPAMAGRA